MRGPSHGRGYSKYPRNRNLKWINPNTQVDGVVTKPGTTLEGYVRIGNSLVRKPVVDSVQAKDIKNFMVPSSVMASSSTLVENFASLQIQSSSTCDVKVVSQTSEISTTIPNLPTETKPVNWTRKVSETDGVVKINISTEQSTPPKVVVGTENSPPLCNSLEATQIFKSLQARMKVVPQATESLYIKTAPNQIVAVSKDLIQPLTGYTKTKPNQIVRTGETSVKVNPVEKLYTPRTKQKIASLKMQILDKKNGVNSTALFSKKPQSVKFRGGSFSGAPYHETKSIGSVLGKKLSRQLNMETIYVKSKNGYSLKRAEIRALKGKSLTWTREKEQKEKHAREIAVNLIMAAERRKVEKKTARRNAKIALIRARLAQKSSALPMIKPRDKIISVGLLNYKVDPKKKTLQLIPENPMAILDKLEKSAPEVSSKFEDFIPVGRNKLIRSLAAQRLKSSLQYTRQRIAKAKTQCLFFSRLGHCKSHESGKCRYQHDPKKVAVCSKFLRGKCVDPKCLLTHQAIPERMPDCSFFIEGTCTNEKCPYRHVQFGSSAEVCQDFLKGICSDKECKNKHTYVCQSFASSGTCKDVPNCKMLHPEQGGGKRDASQAEIEVTKPRKKSRYFEIALQEDSGEEEVDNEPSGLDSSAIPDADLALEFIPLGSSSSDEEEEEEDVRAR